MLIEAARRAEANAREVLSLVNEGSASCAELREMLAVSKATVAIMAAAQTSAAATIAGRERHGDGGAQVLADTAGMARHDAHSRVKTARVIEAAASGARRCRVGAGVAGQHQAARGRSTQGCCTKCYTSCRADNPAPPRGNGDR